jgi:hypothetical protein
METSVRTLLLSHQKRAAHISARIADLYDAHFDQFEATFDDARSPATMPAISASGSWSCAESELVMVEDTVLQL